jgi:hypothetical protein
MPRAIRESDSDIPHRTLPVAVAMDSSAAGSDLAAAGIAGTELDARIAADQAEPAPWHDGPAAQCPGGKPADAAELPE